MEHYKYIQLPFDIIPHDIINEYNLTEMAHNEEVYINIWKGMYGLKKYGINKLDILKK